MEPYNNRSGRSGVVAYESGPDFIKVQFSDGRVYQYTYASAGVQSIELMKLLAQTGQGLNAYINVYARKAYTEKVEVDDKRTTHPTPAPPAVN